MKFPFGKYRGVDITNAPENYLEWLLGWEPLREPLRHAIEIELERRANLRSTPAIKIDTAVVDAIIRAGVRALAKQHHPDIGGDGDQMTKINVVADQLRALVAGDLN